MWTNRMRRSTRSGDPCRLDEGAVAQRQDLGADHARGIAPQDKRHGEHDVPHARLQKGAQDDDERQERDAEGDVGEPHQDAVDRAAEIARDEADEGADADDHDGRRQADEKGAARA